MRECCPSEAFENHTDRCTGVKPPEVVPHEHEPWQIRDDGNGPYCTACGAQVPPAVRFAVVDGLGGQWLVESAAGDTEPTPIGRVADLLIDAINIATTKKTANPVPPAHAHAHGPDQMGWSEDCNVCNPGQTEAEVKVAFRDSAHFDPRGDTWRAVLLGAKPGIYIEPVLGTDGFTVFSLDVTDLDPAETVDILRALADALDGGIDFDTPGEAES